MHEVTLIAVFLFLIRVYGQVQLAAGGGRPSRLQCGVAALSRCELNPASPG